MNESIDILELVEAAYLHGLCVENLDTAELEPPRDISEVKWIADKINLYIEGKTKGLKTGQEWLKFYEEHPEEITGEIAYTMTIAIKNAQTLASGLK